MSWIRQNLIPYSVGMLFCDDGTVLKTFQAFKKLQTYVHCLLSRYPHAHKKTQLHFTLNVIQTGSVKFKCISAWSCFCMADMHLEFTYPLIYAILSAYRERSRPMVDIDC